MSEKQPALSVRQHTLQDPLQPIWNGDTRTGIVTLNNGWVTLSLGSTDLIIRNIAAAQLKFTTTPPTAAHSGTIKYLYIDTATGLVHSEP